MKIMLVAVGRTTTKFLEEGITEYCRRLIRYIPFEIKYIGDIRNTRNLNATQQKQKEGDAILSMLAPQDYVVLLDEHGRELTSRDFAAYIERKMQSIPKQLVFIIGGPYGFSPRVHAAAADKLSLSRMTFSHQMIRLIFAEQIYRAQTILPHEPYHHE